MISDIKYRKPPWGIVKSFLDKNCWAGLEDHYQALSAALDNEVDTKNQEKNTVVSKKKGRRARKSTSRRATSAAPNVAGLITPSVVTNRTGHVPLPRAPQTQATTTGRNYGALGAFILPSLLLILFFISILNILLFYKMWCLESRLLAQVYTQDMDMDFGNIRAMDMDYGITNIWLST